VVGREAMLTVPSKPAAVLFVSRRNSSARLPEKTMLALT
jgi:hypothetical protein